MSFLEHDPHFMRLAVEEAQKARGKTAPNPIVGAVIVREGKILAQGHHTAAGQPHAEIAALRALPSLAQAHGATLYVTLEPCSTFGKTPPCTHALLEAKFARVVYGTTDPNPTHQGRAKKILEQANIEVTTGVLEKECAQLNVHWNHRMKTGRPWVIAKCGMSLDGRISSFPGRRWITSAASRHHAMRLRANVEAILVGGATVREDDPALTIRGLSKKIMAQPQPHRIIWSRSGNIPATAQLLTDTHRERTMVIQNKSLAEALHELAARGISSVLIEGGGRTLGEAFDQQLVDEVHFYVAPLLLGGPTPAVARIFHTPSTTACSKAMNTALDSHCSSGGMYAYSLRCNPSPALSHQLRPAPRDEVYETSGLGNIGFPETMTSFKKISYRTIGNDLLISGWVKK